MEWFRNFLIIFGAILNYLVHHPYLFIPIAIFIWFWQKKSMEDYRIERIKIGRLARMASNKRNEVEYILKVQNDFFSKDEKKELYSRIHLLITEVFILEHGLEIIRKSNPLYSLSSRGGSSRPRKEWQKVRKIFVLFDELHEVSVHFFENRLKAEEMKKEISKIYQKFVNILLNRKSISLKKRKF